MELYEYIAELSGNKRKHLPVPSLNILNGGKHAGNELGIQEFMIFPKNAPSFKEAIRMSSEVYMELRNILKKKYGLNSINVGDEGGFAPMINDAESALDLLSEAIKAKGYDKIMNINLDVAASEMLKNNKYNLNFKSKNSNIMSSEKLIQYYLGLCEKYKIYSIEDPFAEDDWESFSKITKLMGDKIQIVGDDLLVTNPERINKAVKLNACNALLLKINQIGTITESIKASNLMMLNNGKVMVSHRSGETEDDYIADFAVGIGAEEIKSGAVCRSERTAKYNRLMEIEEKTGYKIFGI
jgi:enolase